MCISISISISLSVFSPTETVRGECWEFWENIICKERRLLPAGHSVIGQSKRRHPASCFHSCCNECDLRLLAEWKSNAPRRH